MADDIIAGFEMDIPPGEYLISIKLPAGWRVEIISAPAVQLETSMAAGSFGYHPPDEGDFVQVTALPRKGSKNG